MAADFFEVTAKALPTLNVTERELFNYVIKNIHTVKDMSIQALAKERILSTTTVFRFTKKLGFSGYTDFIRSLSQAEYAERMSKVPGIMHDKSYAQSYLQNIMEAVRVMPAEKIARAVDVLRTTNNVYMICDDEVSDLGRYGERLLMAIDKRAYWPEVSYQLEAMYDYIKDGDLLIVLSYSGEDQTTICTLEKVLSAKRPFILSITRADNNTIQNMSDINFYMFADEVLEHGVNLTTHLPMLIILELLVYQSLQ